MLLFSSWIDVLRIVVEAVVAYAGIIALQRITGKRTLSKMNAFDLIVTVALGSALATVILSKQVAVGDGLAGFATLMGLQYLVTWASVRSRRMSRVIKSDPKLLLYQGEFLQYAMRRERVVEAEVLQAIRASGGASVSDVEAVVLETDGSFSVIGRPTNGQATSLKDVDTQA